MATEKVQAELNSVNITMSGPQYERGATQVKTTAHRMLAASRVLEIPAYVGGYLTSNYTDVLIVEGLNATGRACNSRTRSITSRTEKGFGM